MKMKIDEKLTIVVDFFYFYTKFLEIFTKIWISKAKFYNQGFVALYSWTKQSGTGGGVR